MHNTKIKGIIFDLDGTLYSQKKLRTFMLITLISHYILRPWKFKELLIISFFRKLTEDYSKKEVSGVINKIPNEVAKKYNVDSNQVEKIIDFWMFLKPLPYLKYCIYPGISSLFDYLHQSGYKVGVLSDYPVKKKLSALKLNADQSVSAYDYDIDIFKPNNKGLIKLVKLLGLNVEDCIFIGDRIDRDGLCANNSGMDFYLYTKNKTINDNKLNYRSISSFDTFKADLIIAQRNDK